MTDEQKIVFLSVALGINKIQRKLEKAGILGRARLVDQAGTATEKVEMFEAVARLFDK